MGKRRRQLRGLDRLRWGADTLALTLIVGAEPGRRASTRYSKCRPVTVEALDSVFKRMRRRQGVPASEMGMTRVCGRGVYEGSSEKSCALTAYYNPGTGETEHQFRQNMQRIATVISRAFCQDEVLLSEHGPTVLKTESHTALPESAFAGRRRRRG